MERTPFNFELNKGKYQAFELLVCHKLSNGFTGGSARPTHPLVQSSHTAPGLGLRSSVEEMDRTQDRAGEVLCPGGPGRFQSSTRSNGYKLCCRWHFWTAERIHARHSIYCAMCPTPGIEAFPWSFPEREATAFPWRWSSPAEPCALVRVPSLPLQPDPSCCSTALTLPCGQLWTCSLPALLGEWRQRFSLFLSAHPAPRAVVGTW